MNLFGKAVHKLSLLPLYCLSTAKRCARLHGHEQVGFGFIQGNASLYKALEYAAINTNEMFLTIIEHRITDKDSLAFLAFYM